MRPMANVAPAPSRGDATRERTTERSQSPGSMDAAMADLPTIPVVDVREGGPVRHARDASARARALRDDCLAWLKPSVRTLLPALDAIARRWLRQSRSPYVPEIEAIAAALAYPGIWFLNGSYQWGCTAAARDEAGSPWLARTLDWPFPGLGRCVEIAHMQGKA